MTASARRTRGDAESAAVSERNARRATVHEAKTHLSRLLAEVEAGETVVITRRGKPVARLEAISSKRDRVPGSMKGLIAFDDRFFDPLPDDELELWGEI